MLSPKQLDQAHALNKRYQWLSTAVSRIKPPGYVFDVEILGQRHTGDGEMMEAVRTAILAVYQSRMESIRTELADLYVDPDYDEIG